MFNIFDPAGLFSGGGPGGFNPLDPAGLFGGGGTTYPGQNAPDVPPGFDYKKLIEMYEGLNDKFIKSMEENNRLMVNEGKKYMITQTAQQNIGRAAVDDFRVVEQFVLNNLQTGYHEAEAKMGITAGIPMPTISSAVKAMDAPTVDPKIPEMGGAGDGDPLVYYETHMKNMDQIVAKLDKGEELSDADKDYLAGLKPSIDWRDQAAIRHEAVEARQAYEAYKNARGPAPDLEGFLEWLEQQNDISADMMQKITEAVEEISTLIEMQHAAAENAMEAVDGVLNKIDSKLGIDSRAFLRKIENKLAKFGKDVTLLPSKSDFFDTPQFRAALEEATAALQDVVDELVEKATNSDFPDMGGQSVGGMGTSSINLIGPDSTEELDEAEELLAGL